MTAIVGVIDTRARELVLGADRLATFSDCESTTLEGAEAKVFPVGAMLMGVAGDLRTMQLVRHAFLPYLKREVQAVVDELAAPPHADGDRLFAALVMTVIPALRTFLASMSDLRDDERRRGLQQMGGRILLACQGRLFEISGGFDCVERTTYSAVGDGSQFAEGALYVTTHSGVVPASVATGRERVRLALLAAAAHDLHVGPPFTILTQRIPFPETA